jgi:hypothetical protein
MFNDVYKGIVIQNNDPTHAGRVKVFVPSVNATLIKDWNDNKDENKKIVHLGENTNSALTPDIIQRLKQMLPWARVSLPVFGMSTPGFYDNAKNISYIGNDSDLTSQEGNKTQEFFQQDRQRQEEITPNTPTTGRNPRQNLNVEGLKIGDIKFPLKKCDKENFDSVLKNTSNPCLAPLIAELPTSYPNAGNNPTPTSTIPNNNNTNNNILTPVNNIPPLNENNSISKISINLINPEIFLNGAKIDLKDTIFNNVCFQEVVVENPSVNYEPPIFFEESSDPITEEKIDKIPVTLNINNIPVNLKFYPTPQLFGNNPIAYKSGNTQVEFSKNNMQGTNIRKNSNPIQLATIPSLAPILPEPKKDPFATIIPRIASMAPMLSPGGGAAASYNRPTTKLLPPEQRKESLLGGLNPVSKENRNFGKEDSDENKIQSGSNQQFKPDVTGSYRPPDHTNSFKGMVSIPSPGAQVHVRFENGNTNYPIVIDTFADQADYQNIFGISPT